MAALDFPTATTDGQIFKADNGVWYTWVAAGSYWSGSLGTAIGNLEGYYVNKTGDKMFGNLTLGTEGTTSIVLNATSGAATFDGRLTLNGTGSGTAAYIGNNGEVQITYDGTLTAAGTVFSKGRFDSSRTSGTFPVFQGRLNTTVTSEIKADGSAIFAGIVKSETYLWANASENLAGIYNYQNISTSPIAYLQKDALGENTIILSYDGSAEYAGRLKTSEYYLAKNTSANAGFITYNDTGSARNDAALIVSNNSSDSGRTAYINYDGSASFNLGNTTITSGGQITTRRTDGDNPSFGVWVGQNRAGTNTSIIYADGSASFASGINNPNAIKLDAVNGNVGAQPNVEIQVNGLSNTTAFTIRDVVDTGASVVELNCDGSASFAGTVTTGDLVDASADWTGGGVTVYDAGVIYAGRPTTGTLFVGRQSGNPLSTVKILADGSAEFAGVLDARGLWARKLESSDNAFTATTTSGSQVATITSDGAARFASNVIANDYIKSERYVWANASLNNGGFYNYQNTSTSNDAYIQKNSAGTITISFYYNGNATFNGTINGAVVGTSDARFKENITPAKPQLADVVALGGILKNFDWNDDAPVNDELRAQRQLGLVAQEVAEVCPSIVKDIHRTKTVEVTPAVTGPKGRVITEAVTEEVDDSYSGLSTDALIMKLIGAVAELSAEVEALKSAT